MFSGCFVSKSVDFVSNENQHLTHKNHQGMLPSMEIFITLLLDTFIVQETTDIQHERRKNHALLETHWMGNKPSRPTVTVLFTK